MLKTREEREPVNNYLTSFYTWMAGEGVRKPLKHQKLLLTTKVRMLWRVMIIHVLKEHERRRSVIRSSNVRYFFCESRIKNRPVYSRFGTRTSFFDCPESMIVPARWGQPLDIHFC